MRGSRIEEVTEKNTETFETGGTGGDIISVNN